MKVSGAVASIGIFALLAASRAHAGPQQTILPPTVADALRTFLTSHSESEADPSTEIAAQKINLGLENKDAYAIYIRGGGWCGSGGCVTAIAVRRGSIYKVIAFTPATELPIVLLPTFHDGGRDTGVTLKGVLHGDHFDPPQIAVMSRMGDRYGFAKPTAQLVSSGVGQVLISDHSHFVPLYEADSLGR